MACPRLRAPRVFTAVRMPSSPEPITLIATLRFTGFSEMRNAGHKRIDKAIGSYYDPRDLLQIKGVRMRGNDEQSGHLFSYLSPEQRVPADHPLRAIRTMTDEALRRLSRRFEALYATTGRPSSNANNLSNPIRRLLPAATMITVSIRAESAAECEGGNVQRSTSNAQRSMETKVER